jgi:hypothetical protein
VPPFSPTWSRKNPLPNPNSRAMSMSMRFAACSLPRAYSSRSLPSDGGRAGRPELRPPLLHWLHRQLHAIAPVGSVGRLAACLRATPCRRRGPANRDRPLALVLTCVVASPRRRRGWERKRRKDRVLGVKKCKRGWKGLNRYRKNSGFLMQNITNSGTDQILILEVEY